MDPSSLWSHNIQGIHNLKNKTYNYIANKSITRVWKNIACIKDNMQKVEVPIESVMKKQVNDRNIICFRWIDGWEMNP